MSTAPSVSEMRDYQRRWALIAERERETTRSATLEQKLDEVERLMLSVDDFGWRQALDDDAPVRVRWQRLRERLASRPSAT